MSLPYSPGARMLLGIAIGDAYGVPFENLSFQEAETRLKKEGLICGKYSDDTQQALAIAELLASGEPYTPHSLAKAFLTAYNRDIRQGYSRLTQLMLESTDPDAFLASISDEEKTTRRTDGAAMRALPLGFLPDRARVIVCAEMSAAITHGHPDAIAATVAVALVAHERYYRNTSFQRLWEVIREDIQKINPEIISYCDSCAGLSEESREIILEEYSEYGVPYTESRIFLGALLFLLQQYGDDPWELLLASIRFGGDIDTVAAVAVGAACIRNSENRIWSLIPDLEKGSYGREYLVRVGNQLSARYPSEFLL